MSTSTAGHRTFPSLAIVCILLVACLWLGQAGQPWMANRFPGISGLAKVNPSLIILDMSIRLPITVDLILVPALFILLYTAAILLYPRRGPSRWRQVPYRLGAVFASVIIIACCVTFGSLLSLVLGDHLPKEVLRSFESLGMNADLYLNNKTVPLHGNVIALLGLLIGVGIALNKIGRAPVWKKTTQLTREQRMTPYQRMLLERRREAKFGPKAGTEGVRPTPDRSGLARFETEKADLGGFGTGAAGTERFETRSADLERFGTESADLERFMPGPARVSAGKASRALCCPEPRPTLEPEAVGYRPLG